MFGGLFEAFQFRQGPEVGPKTVPPKVKFSFTDPNFGRHF